jgi:hypothetical protein
MSIFGFSTQASSASGDFLPVLKYDARAGRFFRVDRTDTGGGFESIPTDITEADDDHGPFRAVFDLENLESGWINFPPGAAPSFMLVPLKDMLAKRVTFPEKPEGEGFKAGVRFMAKLANDLANGRPVREVASTAKAFVSAIEELYHAYLAEKDQHPEQLPAVILDGRPQPVKSGSGQQSSTNYRPKFKIVAWVPRGDLHPVRRGQAMPAATHTNGGEAVVSGKKNGTPPSTGATRAPAPKPKVVDVSADDFG